ncbi:hypothetical protein F4V91_31935 [Neorhizobium galegae]|uniref:Uncharacterized protein n=1 Tax=Neorhizobium galegae TaxID=399 RepID=A0A6A1TGG0_NEOGA|nr:hypothetical protein [Neorhizobium galegae]KAB1082565.1 hypothetical protein F4V91_31935 [Neorhizobium galegae]
MAQFSMEIMRLTGSVLRGNQQLWDYGVLDHDEEGKKFKPIDNAAQASAFLSVLDRTVGGEEGAIIPHGLEDALRHITQLAPKLEKDVRFQRLLTLSRR